MRHFRSSSWLAVIGVFVPLITPSVAQTGFFLTCTAPAGQRAEYGTLFSLEGAPVVTQEDGIVWSPDGFSNVYPMFLWRPTSPDQLFFTWGDARPPGLPLSPDLTFESATVVYRDEQQVQAAMLKCGTVDCTFSSFAVFPQLGFITRTDSYFTSFFGRPGEGTGVTRVFASTCSPFR